MFRRETEGIRRWNALLHLWICFPASFRLHTSVIVLKYGLQPKFYFRKPTWWQGAYLQQMVMFLIANCTPAEFIC